MIDFLKYRKLCYLGSVVILVVGVAAYAMRGGFRYHIDFSGGSEIRVAFTAPLEISKLRSAVEGGGWHGAVIQSVGTGSEFIVTLGDNQAGVAERFEAMLVKSLPDNQFQIRSVDQVGAQAGREVSWNAVKAIIFSLIGLALYITARYQFAYAMGAVVSLAHDILVVLSFLLIIAEPFSLNILAGILLMLGYSLNDTIVVFSRIRESAGLHRGMDHVELVNLSINQTLSRTILTSFATLLTVLGLYFIGGEALRGLSLTMLVAIIFGTYSSIFIASPVMLALKAGKEL